MEPLSIAASVVGLLGATSKVSKILSTFVNSGKSVPSLAEHVLREVSNISTVFIQLKGFLDDSQSISPSRKKLVMIDQVRVTLAASALTFSELESILMTLNVDNPKQLWARVAWVRHESSLKELLERLQWSKLSLSLMLTTLTCATMGEATNSVATLDELVHQLLQSNRELSSRLSSLESNTSGRRLFASSSSCDQQHAGDDASSTGPKSRDNLDHAKIDEVNKARFAFAFDNDLHNSWVYNRALRRNAAPSLPSSSAKSFGWSCLSDLSLADVSNISAISLPVTGNDLKNPEHYGVQERSERRTSVSRQALVTNRRYTSVRVQLLGLRSSGMTSISKQLHIMHSGGFQQLERLEYRGIIWKALLNTGVFTLHTVAICGVDCWFIRPDSIKLAQLQSTPEERYNFEHLGTCPDFGSSCKLCVHALSSLTAHSAIQRKTRTINNLDYFMTRLLEISDSGYIPSESDILHVRNKSYKRFKVEIDSILYRFAAARAIPNRDYSQNIRLLQKIDFFIFTVSLLDYCRLSSTSTCFGMSSSLESFERLCDNTDAPIILIFTRLDLLKDTMKDYPLCNFVPDVSKYTNSDQACDFFADQFQARDRRPKGELHIYFTNTIDTRDFENIWTDIRENVFTHLPQYSGSSSSQRVDRRPGVWSWLPRLPLT